MTTPSAQPAANLDFLRSFAVACVFVSHLLPTIGFAPPWWQPLGTFGVAAFFVHTSLVLLMSMERTHSAPGFVQRFYIRRAFRIYPLAMVTTLIAWGLWIPPYSWLSDAPVRDTRALFADLFLVQNITRTPDVITSLWTLPYEVQMYLALPFLFLCLRKPSARSLPWMLLAWCCCCAAVELLSAAGARYGAIPALIWRLAQFVPCFLAGAVAWQLRNRVRTINGSWWVVLVCALALLYTLPSGRGFYPITWTTSLALGLTLPFFREIKFGKRFFHMVATYSYGVYLVHIPVFWLIFTVLRNQNTILRMLLLVLLSVAVPLIAYHCVEHPMIELGSKMARRFSAGGVRIRSATGAQT